MTQIQFFETLFDLSQQKNLYAFFDPHLLELPPVTAHPASAIDVAATVPDHVAEYTIVSSELPPKQYISRLPWLVRITHKDEFLNILHKNGLLSCCVYLSTECSLAEILSGLLSLCWADLPGGEKAWFRIADPEIFQMFMTHSTPSQQTLLCNNLKAQAFVYSLVEKELIQYPLSELQKKDIPETFTLTAKQYDDMTTAGIEILFKNWAVGYGHELLPSYPAQDKQGSYNYLQKIKDLVAEAEQYGLMTTDIIWTYVQVAIQLDQPIAIKNPELCATLADNSLGEFQKRIALENFQQDVLKQQPFTQSKLLQPRAGIST